MKYLVNLMILAALIGIPAKSFANLKGFQINAVVAWDDNDEECAVEGEITEIEGGFINGNERLWVNGLTWGSFNQLGSFEGYSVGDKIAFGTLELGLRLNYNFDITLDTDICRNLQNGDTLGFDGSFDSDITQVDLPMIMLNYGLALENGSYATLNLNEDSYVFTNLNWETVQIGAGIPINPDGDNNGDGCSLGGAIPGGAMSYLALFLTGLSTLLALRKRS